ncbi:hypothetical protein [Bifidobacterium hapali]
MGCHRSADANVQDCHPRRCRGKCARYNARDLQ